MAGVYDIAQHLKYEAGRGVRYLSTMERALGGKEEFASQSPSVILAQAAGLGREESSEDSAAAGRCAAVRCCANARGISTRQWPCWGICRCLRGRYASP